MEIERYWDGKQTDRKKHWKLLENFQKTKTGFTLGKRRTVGWQSALAAGEGVSPAIADCYGIKEGIFLCMRKN